VKLNPYRRWRDKKAQAEALCKRNYHRSRGMYVRAVPVSFFRIASLPTIRKEDLMYLRINYVNGSLTTSTETKSP